MATKKPTIMIHAAVSTIAPEYAIGMSPNGRPQTIKDGEDREICQFAVEFERWPIPESAMKKAFDNMYLACLAKARLAGLVRA